LDAVGDDQVGVQQRITLPGCPVIEADRQQPPSGHMLDTTVAATGPQMLIQVANRIGQPGMMGSQHRPSSRRVTEAVEDRHALGRPQDHIEAWHGVAAMRAPQQLGGPGVPAIEHGLEPGHRCFALQPQGGGGSAVPPA
jgi:hypothetical protein